MTTNFKRSPPVIKGIITQVSIPIKKIHNKNKCRSVIWILLIIYGTHNQGRFPHETESPLPLHFKHSSLLEKGELVQVRFTQRLRDQRRICMEDGCSVHGFLHGIEWIMFHGIYNYFQKPPLGGRPNTKPLGDHGTQNAHNRWFILLYHV